MSKSSRLKVTAAIAQMSPEVDVIAEAAVDQEGQTFLLVILSSFPRWISSASKWVYIHYGLAIIKTGQEILPFHNKFYFVHCTYFIH